MLGLVDLKKVVCVALWAACSSAQGAELDVTMTLMPEATARPDAVTRQIALPHPAIGARSADGLETANAQRARAAVRRSGALAPSTPRDANAAAAASARARGAEFGAEIGAAARENRESFIRGVTGLDLPVPDRLRDSIPTELPERLDLPAPPSSPGGT